MISFKELGLSEEVLKGIEEQGFQYPTPVQEKVIQFIFNESTDVVALAQTGTGKTAAFGLPACQNSDVSLKSIQTLVIAPTRELCVQITRELKAYGKYVKGLRIEAVYGGESIEKQIKAIQNTPHILVATPGRLTDFIKRKRVDLSQVKSLVLDEADEMLDMGFKDDIQFIIAKTPDERRTLLFSATMSREVMNVAKNYMTDAIEISIGKKNSGTNNVAHSYYLVENRNRYNALKRLADIFPEIYGIVFCRTRRETQEIADFLTRDGYNADALHGDLSQAQRDSVMKKFRDKNLNLLVATDVAARGIDVNNLTHVINYNLPDDIETYTHRSGRTGRANSTGISIALVTPSEKHKIRQVEKNLQQTFEQKQLPGGEEILQKQIHNFVSKIETSEVSDEQMKPLMEEIYQKLEYMDKKELINHFISYEVQRFLQYYKNAPDLNVKARDDRGERRDSRDSGRESRNGRSSRDGGKKMKLEINLGLKDGMNPGKLLGMINEVWGNAKMQVGKIDLQSRFAQFEVNAEDGEKLASLFKNKLNDDGINVKTLGLTSGSGRRESGGSGGGSRSNFRRPRR